MSSHPVTHTQHNEQDTPVHYSPVFRAVFDPNDHGIDPLTASQRMIFEERRRMRDGRSGNDEQYSRRSLRQRKGHMVGVSFIKLWTHERIELTNPDLTLS